jgi:CHAT domain-containing protein
MMNFQRLHSAAQQNPLARSGLAFAGANTVLDGGNLPPEAEDGLLTAQGASGINLAATALVVASACQTALGDVQVGEGVLGLRRAFVLAGVQTLVMSLWSVPDVATAILMERFYHNLLTEKMGRAKALEQAQFYVRDLTIAQMRPQWLTPEAITRITDRNLDIGNQLRELSQKPENYHPYAHPRYWGAFICQGDASPLF